MARKFMDEYMQNGGWLIINRCHLATAFINSIEEKL
jgi:hypothetical protein